MSSENPLEDIELFESKLKCTQNKDSDSSHEEIENLSPSSHATKVEVLEHELSQKEQKLVKLQEELGAPLHTIGTLEQEELNYKENKLSKLVAKNKRLLSNIATERKKAAEAAAVFSTLKEEFTRKPTAKGWKQNTLHREQGEDFKSKCVFFEKQYQDMKLQLFKAKNTLKKYKRLIRRDIGEFENLDTFLMKNWRGRAELLERLRKTENELKQQLADKGQTQVKTDHLGPSNRRKELELLAGQIASAREEIEKWKKQAQGVASRKIVLGKEVRENKETSKKFLSTLREKTENDSLLITELRNELERVKRTKGISIVDPSQFDGEIANLKTTIFQLKSVEEQLKTHIQDKNEVVEMFRQCPGDDGEIIPNEIEYKLRIQQLKGVIKKHAKASEGKSANENARIIKEVTSQNVRLRAKANQLSEELSKYSYP